MPWTGPDEPPTRVLHIAVLAPPWISIPPQGYGGIEAVVALLCEGLVERGHRVTLFAAPRSHSSADVYTVLEETHPDEMQHARWEADHVGRAFDAIDAAATAHDAFDVVHDHTGFSALAMAHRLGTPLVHTLHGPFEPHVTRFYECHGRKARLVAVSASQRDGAPPALRGGIDVVHNPLAVDHWPFGGDPDEYVLWMGRMTDSKGPQRAIRAARAAGVPLVVAGPVQRGQEEFFAREVKPEIDGDAVRYAGEVGGDQRRSLYARARALLMPIRWAEPFGMVMIEAMACGTPVIAFPEGSACELIVDGETGFLVDDEDAMARAVGRLDAIDRRRCRAHVDEHFAVPRIAARYEQVFERAIAARGPFARGRRFAASPPPHRSHRSEAAPHV